MFTSFKTKKLSSGGVVMRIFFQVEHSALQRPDHPGTEAGHDPKRVYCRYSRCGRFGG